MKQSYVTAAAAALALMIGMGTGQQVQAAPQILAVVAMADGAGVVCHGGKCHTDLSAFCLQKNRDIPHTGTVYHPSGDHFALKVTLEDGRTDVIDVGEGLSFSSRRGFTSVRVAIDPKILSKPVKVARLIVKPNASLIPAAVPGDPDPLSPGEIAYVTGSLRKLGSETIDQSPKAKASHLLNQAIATITEPRDRATPERLRELWKDVVEDFSETIKRNPEALDRAQKAFDRCTAGAAYYSMAGVRSCLEYRHGDLMAPLNSEYWERAEPGS